jgi:hypothetical protein
VLDAPAEIIGLQTTKGAPCATGEVADVKTPLLGSDEHPGLIEIAAGMLKSGEFPPNPKSYLCSAKYCPRMQAGKFTSSTTERFLMDASSPANQTSVSQQRQLQAMHEVQLPASNQAVDMFTERGFALAVRLAKAYSSSDAVPACFRQSIEKKGRGGSTWIDNPAALGNCLVAIETARAVGVSITSVMQNANIIEGRLTWSAQYKIAAINASGRFTPLRFDLKNLGASRPRTGKSRAGTSRSAASTSRTSRSRSTTGSALPGPCRTACRSRPSAPSNCASIPCWTWCAPPACRSSSPLRSA